MKRFFVIVAALSITAWFSSCKKDISCNTPVIGKVLFYSSLSSSPVPDTAVTLIKARKNTGFAQVSETYGNILLTKVDFNKSLTLPDHGEDSYDYDWKITMKPSGKVFKITKISHESSSSKTSQCTNTVSYRVNDSLITIPGNPYASVPYFVSDIQVRYN